MGHLLPRETRIFEFDFLCSMLEQNVYPGIIEWTQGGDAFVVKVSLVLNMLRRGFQRVWNAEEDSGWFQRWWLLTKTTSAFKPPTVVPNALTQAVMPVAQ